MLSISYGPCHPCHLCKHQLWCYLDWLHLCFSAYLWAWVRAIKMQIRQPAFLHKCALSQTSFGPQCSSCTPCWLCGKTREDQGWHGVGLGCSPLFLLYRISKGKRSYKAVPLCNAVQYALGQNRFGRAGGPAVSILSHRDLLGQHRRWTLLVFLTFWDHGERKKENYLFFFFYASNA